MFIQISLPTHWNADAVLVLPSPQSSEIFPSSLKFIEIVLMVQRASWLALVKFSITTYSDLLTLKYLITMFKMSWITFWSGNQAAVMIWEEYIWLFSNCSTEIFVKCFCHSALRQYNFHLEMERCQRKNFCILYILRNGGSGLFRAKRGVSSTSSLFSSCSYCD